MVWPRGLEREVEFDRWLSPSHLISNDRANGTEEVVRGHGKALSLGAEFHLWKRSVNALNLLGILPPLLYVSLYVFEL